jgi:hypothetical protein
MPLTVTSRVRALSTQAGGLESRKRRRSRFPARPGPADFLARTRARLSSTDSGYRAADAGSSARARAAAVCGRTPAPDSDGRVGFRIRRHGAVGTAM